ncbi:MAG TPA: NAD-dependent malic enzyme [Candidatus Limnocylindria bacterium]|nr:NAD-dependent malic enzyme [Candidatus Limnocylindria bacterium]
MHAIEPGARPAAIGLRGPALLADRRLNKDNAFSDAERDALGLRGLLPPRVLSLTEQARLELEHVRRKHDDLERYIGLAALQDRNETLFYRLLRDNLDELMPIVYTPTVGLACQQFSHILRRTRGLWLTPDDAHRLPQVLRNAADQEIRLIVATDNERILGLGDQGAGGMGIPIGKLAIYVAAAGVHPGNTLPISLDVGTDNRDLLDDPLYLGYRQPRLRGAAYEDFVDAFVQAVRSTFPRALLQWEDFKGANAHQLLARYRHELPSFNDDIQGTGATVLAGVEAASRRLRIPLHGLRFLVVGAGAAGLGIGQVLAHAVAERGGEPRRSMLLIDREGIVHADRPAVAPEKAPFTVDPAAFRPELLAAGGAVRLADVIADWRPDVLIGTTAVQGRFDEPAIRALSRVSPTPVVMALSNPITACEVTPAEVMAWTDGRAIVATGSPFDPVPYAGQLRPVGQGNNAFVFPGLGLGAIVAEARWISEGMLVAAARSLAEAVSADRLDAGLLYPPISELPSLAETIAAAVAREAGESGIGLPMSDDEIQAAVRAATWDPVYEPYLARE